jgi:hypothetical protein
MYHVIMNDPMKTRKVLSCMAITAIIKNKKKLSYYFFYLLSSLRFLIEINLLV